MYLVQTPLFRVCGTRRHKHGGRGQLFERIANFVTRKECTSLRISNRRSHIFHKFVIVHFNLLCFKSFKTFVMKMFRFLFLTLFPMVLGFHDLSPHEISVSEECEKSDVTLIFNTTFPLVIDSLIDWTSIDEVCDDDLLCTYDFTPVLKDYKKTCKNVRGSYA